MTAATPAPGSCARRAKRTTLTVIRSRDLPDDLPPPPPAQSDFAVCCTVQVATIWPCVANPGDRLYANEHGIVRVCRAPGASVARSDVTFWTTTEWHWDRVHGMENAGGVTFRSLADWARLGYQRMKASSPAMWAFVQACNHAPRPVS